MAVNVDQQPEQSEVAALSTAEDVGNTPMLSQVSSVSGSGSINIESVDTLQQLYRMEPDQQLNVISEVFATHASNLNLYLPGGFLDYCIKGMMQLKKSGRSNFLYALAKGLGTQNQCGTDSVFPTKSVLTGLVEYSANFFNATTVAQVRFLKCIMHLKLLIAKVSLISGGVTHTVEPL